MIRQEKTREILLASLKMALAEAGFVYEKEKVAMATWLLCTTRGETPLIGG